MKRFIPIVLGLFLSSTSFAQQPGKRGDFDPSQLPKIGVLSGIIIDKMNEFKLASFIISIIVWLAVVVSLM